MSCYLVHAGDIMQKYFHVRSNLRLIRINFEYFQEKKTLHVEGSKIPKPNLKFTDRLTRLLNLDTYSTMYKTNSEVTK